MQRARAGSNASSTSIRRLSSLMAFRPLVVLLAAASRASAYIASAPTPRLHVRARCAYPVGCADHDGERIQSTNGKSAHIDPLALCTAGPRLERLFRDSGALTPATVAVPGAIANLPLLQVPGHTVLPGVIQVMLISGPEWVHCFSELHALAASAEGAQPARFGHLQAHATIGVLMELREVRPLADGRLTVVAQAICRFRVQRSTARVPLPRADVALLPDDEELGLTRLRRETDAAPTGRLPRQLRAEAARAAAAAAALTWAARELPPAPKPARAPMAAAPGDAQRRRESGGDGRAGGGAGTGESVVEGSGGGGAPSSAGEAGAALLTLAEAMSPFVHPAHRWHEVGEALAPMNLGLSIAGCAGAATEAAVLAAKAAIEHVARPAAPEPARAEGTPGTTAAAAQARKQEAAQEAAEEEKLLGYLESLGLEHYDGFTVPGTGAGTGEHYDGFAVPTATGSRLDAAGTGARDRASGSLGAHAPLEASASSSPPTKPGAAATAAAAATATATATAVPPLEVSLPSSWASGSSPFLLALEHATWVELVACLRLSANLAATEAARAATQVDDAAPPAGAESDGASAGAAKAHASAASDAGYAIDADGAVVSAPPPLVLGPRAADGAVVSDSVALPEQLLLLMPPPPRQGWPTGMPSPPSAAQWLQRWGYPPVRRAQRLSYLVGAALPTLLASSALPSGLPLPAPPASLDRQALLQATSVRERLQKAVVFLCHTRQSLAALAALRAADADAAEGA